MRIIIVVIAMLVFRRLGWNSMAEFAAILLVGMWAAVNDAVELLDHLDAMGGDDDSDEDDKDDKQ